MTTSRRLAAVTTSVILGATGLTGLTTTPASAASCVGGFSRTLADGSVKITWAYCDRTNALGFRQRKVTGTLRDTKENGYNAVANVAIGSWSMGVKTGSSKSFDTGWKIRGDVGIVIFNA